MENEHNFLFVAQGGLYFLLFNFSVVRVKTKINKNNSTVYAMCFHGILNFLLKCFKIFTEGTLKIICHILLFQNLPYVFFL